MAKDIWRDWDREKLEREYSPSSCIDDIKVYIKMYNELSAKGREACAKNLLADVRYGPEERSVMDVFVPDGDGPFPVHVFIHGGYWQMLSKLESSFAAPNFIDQDIIFIALDYTLAPEATMPEIIEQTRRGLISILKTAHNFKGDPGNVSISGSSAGGHLAAEMLSTDWPAWGFDSCPLKAALLVSGVFDVRPLVHTYVNDPLGLDEPTAEACSPMFHLPEHSCPILVTYGENETAEFKRQSEDYFRAMLAKGASGECFELPVVNHFDIVMELNRPDSLLFRKLEALIRSE
ncbi:alpha/beta hydrolase [Emcibacter nanhaiensis]|uniref:Alpha/beta hydrolase n=1 Tax=Emcibacter nanhaiensis TaxID=1505037 RepID=A0A501PSC2_9PROT|nr:alpha/beta hydrolase [Emcibacter nanhaiensis]TPD63145.1 alpha/beta hydrolase [Emcibacter nanhaiensis]